MSNRYNTVQIDQLRRTIIKAGGIGAAGILYPGLATAEPTIATTQTGNNSGYSDDFSSGSLEDYVLRGGSLDNWNIEDKIDGNSLHVVGNANEPSFLFVDPDSNIWPGEGIIKFDFKVDTGYFNKNAIVKFGSIDDPIGRVKFSVEGDQILGQSVNLPDDDLYSVKVEVEGQEITVTLPSHPDKGPFTATLEEPSDSGTVGLGQGTNSRKTGETWFDNFRVNPSKPGKGKPNFYTISVEDINQNPVSQSTVWLFNVPPEDEFKNYNPDKIKIIAKGITGNEGKLTLDGPDSEEGFGEQTAGRALLQRQFDKYRKQYDGDIVVHALASNSTSPSDRVWFESLSAPIDSWFPEDGDASVSLVLDNEMLYREVTDFGAVGVWRTIDRDDPTNQEISFGISRADSTDYDVIGKGRATFRVSENVVVNYSDINSTLLETDSTKIDRVIAFTNKEDRPRLPTNPLVGGLSFEQFTPESESSEIQKEATRSILGSTPVVGSLLTLSNTFISIFDLNEGYDHTIGSNTEIKPNEQDLVTEVWNSAAFSFVHTTSLSIPSNTMQNIAVQANWTIAPTVTAKFEEEFSIKSNPDGPA